LRSGVRDGVPTLPACSPGFRQVLACLPLPAGLASAVLRHTADLTRCLLSVQVLFDSASRRTTARVVDGCLCTRLRLTDAQYLRHDAADFGGCVELSLALAALRGEVPHQILVRVPEQVIPFGAVLRKIQRLALEDGDQVRQTIHHLLAAAELVRVIEIGEIRELVRTRQRRNDLLIDLVADVGLALQRHHILETRPRGYRDRRIRHARILIADVLDEQQHQHIILIL